jgi:hypothetical protein
MKAKTRIHVTFEWTQHLMSTTQRSKLLYIGILIMHSFYGQLKPLGIDLNDNNTDLLPSWRVRRWSTKSGPLCKFESMKMARIT